MKPINHYQWPGALRSRRNLIGMAVVVYLAGSLLCGHQTPIGHQVNIATADHYSRKYKLAEAQQRYIKSLEGEVVYLNRLYLDMVYTNIETLHKVTAQAEANARAYRDSLEVLEIIRQSYEKRGRN
jgi:transcriptional regulator with PAS, ATPase and Fis domain